MIVKGTIVAIGDNVQVTDKFTKRELVITFKNDKEYDQYLSINCSLDYIRKALDNFGVGQSIEVEVSIGGRKYTDKATGVDKYFNSIDCFRIVTPNKESSKTVTTSSDEDEEDLPF